MSEDQFTKLFKYMEKRFDDIDKRLGETATKTDISEIYDKLDGMAGKQDDDEVERAALQLKVDRHDGWITQLAQKTDTKLVSEA